MVTEQSRPSAPLRSNMAVVPTDRPDELTVRGPEAVARLRNLVRGGDLRRVWIKNEEGRTLIEIPLTLGVRAGAALSPVWAAVGALAAVTGELTIVVQREPAWPRYDD